MPPSTLTPSEIDRFVADGCVMVRGAVPIESITAIEDAMWVHLSTHGIVRDDRSTWTRPFSGFNRTVRHPVHRGIASVRTRGAIDDLVGASRWQVPAKWGGFAVTFPEAGVPWQPIVDGWHWDCWPDGDGAAIFAFVLASRIAPGGGGTLVVTGSHRRLARYHAALVPDDLRRKQRWHNARFCAGDPWLARLTGKAPRDADPVSDFMERGCVDDQGHRLRVVEACGEAGDVLLCHPYLLHARSHNRAETPRFMRIKMLAMAPGQRRDDPLSQAPIARALRPLGASATAHG